ncbi:MAG: histidine kinase dimerization/phosphoacceptor domain -containing protein [Bacteroidota bacterium]|nr:histidine kinase dimerization/phosphoacceptor domain -containing protein [Bacteroidota bacterium]
MKSNAILLKRNLILLLFSICSFVFSQSNSQELKVKSLIDSVNFHFDNAKYERASELTDELISVSRNFTKSKEYPDICRIIGRRFHFQGIYSKALEYYLNGLNASEKINDSTRVAEMSNLIGGIYLGQPDNDKAFFYYNKGLQIQLLGNQKKLIGRGYLNIANVYIAKKEYGKAKTALNNSLFNYDLLNFNEGKSLVYATFGELFLAKQMPDSALHYLLMGHNYLLQLNKVYPITQINTSIAELYFNKNDFKKALEFLDEGIKFGLSTKQNHNLSSLYLLKSKVLEKTNETKAAYENFKLYKQYSDSILNAASIKKQAEDALKYEFSKKEYEQELKNQKLAIEQKEKEKQQKIILFSSVGIILIIFLLLYYRYRLKQKANKLLTQTNLKLAEKNLIIEEKSKQLQESLGERELLLKEIHHRVKNNLQVISGLLELQKEELTEESSKLAFDEGQSRVRSISLIHQNLYQNENLGSIQFKTFVTDLSLQVKEVFEQLDYKMDITIDMPDKIVDIDTAVPLGLIINELLTNSYKYATIKCKTGKIVIQLQDFNNGHYVLNYSDSGPGIKHGVDFTNANTLGLRLIKGLAGQLSGKAIYKNEGTSTFIIEFKDTATRQKE